MTDYFGGQTNYSYDALGRLTSLSNSYLYIVELGYYGDGDAGMYLLTQRWYNPLIGRFVVRDPASEDLNFYIYTLNNPASRIDPKGSISIGAVACIVCGGIIDLKGLAIIAGCIVGCRHAIHPVECIKGCLKDELGDLLDIPESIKEFVKCLKKDPVKAGPCFACAGWLLDKLGEVLDKPVKASPKSIIITKPSRPPKIHKPGKHFNYQGMIL